MVLGAGSGGVAVGEGAEKGVGEQAGDLNLRERDGRGASLLKQRDALKTRTVAGTRRRSVKGGGGGCVPASSKKAASTPTPRSFEKARSCPRSRDAEKSHFPPLDGVIVPGGAVAECFETGKTHLSERPQAVEGPLTFVLRVVLHDGFLGREQSFNISAATAPKTLLTDLHVADARRVLLRQPGQILGDRLPPALL